MVDHATPILELRLRPTGQRYGSLFVGEAETLRQSFAQFSAVMIVAVLVELKDRTHESLKVGNRHRPLGPRPPRLDGQTSTTTPTRVPVPAWRAVIGGGLGASVRPRGRPSGEL